MKTIRGYGSFLKSLNNDNRLKLGVIADTNVLVAATYELDPANSEAAQFFDLLIENEVPVFCNVNVRNEFLEIHRRILFTEALLDFETEVEKSKLPDGLRKKLTSIRARAGKKQMDNKAPFRLSEPEIKDFKLEMSKVTLDKSDLWTALCENRIGDKLGVVWKAAQTDGGLNFLSARKEEQSQFFNKEPNWDDVIQLVSKYGLSSSDAMITNMFLCSKFVGMVTSDLEVAVSINKMGNPEKILFLPDRLAKGFT